MRNRQTTRRASAVLLVGLAACSTWSASGCKGEPAEVAAKDAGIDSGIDAVVPPAVSPPVLFARLPELPPPAVVPPGSTEAELWAAATPLKVQLDADPFTPLMLHQAVPDGGAFTRVDYLLEILPVPDQSRRVRVVLLTFNAKYRAGPAWASLLDTATRRMGKPEQFDRAPYQGYVWKTEGYRIELRHDTSNLDAELLFHLEGRRELDIALPKQTPPPPAPAEPPPATPLRPGE